MKCRGHRDIGDHRICLEGEDTLFLPESERQTPDDFSRISGMPVFMRSCHRYCLAPSRLLLLPLLVGAMLLFLGTQFAGRPWWPTGLGMTLSGGAGEEPGRSAMKGEGPERSRMEGEEPDRIRMEGEKTGKRRVEGDEAGTSSTEGEEPDRSRMEGEEPEKSRMEGEEPEKSRVEGDEAETSRTEKEELERNRMEGEGPEKIGMEGQEQEKRGMEEDEVETIRTEEELEKSRMEEEEPERSKVEAETQEDENRNPSCPPPGRLISAKRGGRLGNVMFEYASLLGASHTLRRPAWLLPDMADVLTPHFEALSAPVLPRGCRYNWTETRVEDLLRHASKSGAQDHLIIGYPTAVPVFHALRQEVLREFTFRPELRARAQRRLVELARQANLTTPTFIAVHVRRTDYDAWLAKFVGGRLIGVDYLRRALALMRRRHPDALFVVASDDPVWCRQHLNDSDVVLAGDGVQARPGDDLALLAACNHSVLTHGTFGFWAAYLAGGEVVKPTGFGERTTGLEANVRRAGLDWTWLPAFGDGSTQRPAAVG